MLENSDHLSATKLQSLFFERWILLLILAASNAGLENVSRTQFHRILYLSFSTAQFYKIKPLAYRPRRTSVGPYFRQGHDALMRLVISGHLDIFDFKPIFDERNFQFNANFSLSLLGIHACDSFRETGTGRKLYLFLVDLCLALIEDAADDETFEYISRDPTYMEAQHIGNTVVVFSGGPDDVKKPTINGLHEIDAVTNSKGMAVRRDAMRTFNRLLQKKAA